MAESRGESSGNMGSQRVVAWLSAIVAALAFAQGLLVLPYRMEQNERRIVQAESRRDADRESLVRMEGKLAMIEEALRRLEGRQKMQGTQ